MPQMGVSVADGTIIEWRKHAGDEVAADETICEVTTDKIDVEIPAPAAGTLRRILVEEGETVDGGHGPGGSRPSDLRSIDLPRPPTVSQSSIAPPSSPRSCGAWPTTTAST